MRTCAFVALVCTLTIAATYGDSTSTLGGALQLLTNYPLAVCNDGTPSGYYYRPGYGNGSNTFLIYLDGGAWCWDEPSCVERWQGNQSLMSSDTWPNQKYYVEHSGLLSSSAEINPDFYDANLIEVAYCTSDSYVGTANSSFPKNIPSYEGSSSSSTNTDWVFHGRYVIDAIVAEVVSMASLNPDIVLAGCSAGGQGVVNVADRVGELLADAGVGGTYVAVADAAWLLDLPTVNNSIVSFYKQMKQGSKLWSAVYSPACLASMPSDAWYMCAFSNIATPYIETPILIHTEQYDPWQLFTNEGWILPPFNETANTLALRESFRKSFATTLAANVTAPQSVYSGACFHHCLTADTTFTTIKINGKNFATHLSEWLPIARGMAAGNADALAASKDFNFTVIDDCAGFNCSIGCTYYVW